MGLSGRSDILVRSIVTPKLRVVSDRSSAPFETPNRIYAQAKAGYRAIW